MNTLLRSSRLSLLVGLAFSSTPAWGQGETCNNPTVLSGLGTFAFDTTGFLHSSFDEQQNCDIVIGPGENLDGDGFFVWTAPAAGDYLFVAEGRFSSGLDWSTQMAIYDGDDCSATCVANDNNSGPGRASMIRLPNVLAGQSLLIQIGGYDFFNNGNPTIYQGPGTLDISNTPIQCQNPVDDSFENNDSCGASTPLTPGTYTGLFFSISDPDYYSITIPTGHSLRTDLLASDLELFFYLFDDSCNLLDIRFTESWIYTNTTGAPETIIVQPRRSSVAEAVPCSFYDVEFTIQQDPCQGAVDDAFEDNDFSNQRATLDSGTYPGLFIKMDGPLGMPDRDYYSLLVSPGATVQALALFDHSQLDINLLLLNSNGNILADSLSQTDNEVLTWTNTTGTTFDASLLVYIAGTGSQVCANYDLIVTGLDGGLGQEFCTPNSNSTGESTLLIGSSGPGTGSGLHLEAVQGPPGEFGFLLIGDTDASPGITISDGVFCLIGTPGAQVFRYNITGTPMNSVGQFDSSGVLKNLAGTSITGYGFDVPNSIPGHGPILTGETWHFQCWHRDSPSGVGRSNLSNGVSVGF